VMFMAKHRDSIAAILIVAGFSIWIPIFILNLSALYFFVSSAFGIMALVILGNKRPKKVRAALCFLLIICFFIFVMVGYIIEFANNSKINRTVMKLAPKHTQAIKVTQIYDLISFNQPESVYIYFGGTTCTACINFQKEFELVYDNPEPTVYYYNAEEMPIDEAKAVFAELGLEYVPIIVKIDKGVITDSVNNADRNQIKQLLMCTTKSHI